MKTRLILLAASLTICVVFFYYGRGLWYPTYIKLTGKRTVADVVSAVGTEARSRLLPYFNSSGVTYPPKKITLLATKDNRRLELWANENTGPKYIRTFQVQAQSGLPGPKLREGDRQVPEGVYRIEGLNPNSSYYLSMKLNYPNEFDLIHAQVEERQYPGSNIFIHGKAVSIGCLAMGDEVIEELFVLVHDVGKSNVKVVIAPTDPRRSSLDASAKPAWVTELYDIIENEFKYYVQNET
ncbi:MAG: L,D-transpeptidase family protein [Gammaproteobacteria bacterium]|nr:L,D-transpeptidase family protein [Gammaproteobacteria bacterium]